jgi:hypothetical protein
MVLLSWAGEFVCEVALCQLLYAQSSPSYLILFLSATFSYDATTDGGFRRRKL